MAKLTVHGNWRSILALASLLALVGILVVSLAAGKSLGIWLYLFSILAMSFGFWSKEDHIAVGGIIGLFLVMTLDIVLRIGLLGFTECKPDFSALYGCP